MAEFNRTSLDIMDELYAPFKEAQAQKQGLERQAGGAALSRELQLRDAATKRSQQVLDAQTAHDRGLANITKAAEEQARMQKEASEYRDAENLKERRGQAITLREKLEKAGVYMGVSLEELQNAKSGALMVHLKDLSSEYETFKASKKSSADIIEKLKSLNKHAGGVEMIRGTLGLEPGEPINWEALQDEPQPYLSEILGDATSKHLLLKGKDSWVPRWNTISKQLHEAMTDVDLFSVASGENAEAQSDFSKWVAQDLKFKDELKGVIKADWDLNPFSSNEQLKYDGIISDLQAGNLDEVINKLRAEGEAASTPLIGAFTNWLAASEAKSAAAINAKIFNKQNAVSNLRSLLDARDKMLVRHPELDTLDDTHYLTNKDYDRLAERNRPDAPTPDAPTPDADPGGLGSLYPDPQQNTQAAPVAPLSDIESEIDSINNITSPEVEAPIATPIPSPPPTSLPMYDTGAAELRERGFNPEAGLGKGMLRGRLEQGVKRFTHTNPTILGGPSMPQELVDYLEKYAPMPVSAHSRSGSRPRWKVQSSLSPEKMGSILDKVQQGLIPPPPNIDIGQIMEVLAPTLRRFNPVENPTVPGRSASDGGALPFQGGPTR